MEKTKAVPFALAIYATSKDGGYAHVRGYTCGVDMDEDNRPKTVDRYSVPLHGLRINSQCDEGSKALYGWDYGIDAEYHYMVRPYDAERIVALLRPIEKRMTKLYNNEGNAQTFGAYVNRIARATGAAYIFVKKLDYDNNLGWRRYSLGDAVSAVDHLTRATLLSVNPYAESVA